jgi:tol-pal system protein YbgF
MIRENPIAPATIVLALSLAFLATVGAGCAGPAGGGSPSNEDFEIRAMIAADRQQMQAMDERLRRLEGQIQDLSHSASPTDTGAAPGQGYPPPAGAPAMQTAPGVTSPAPAAPPAGGGAMAPGGAEMMPPGAAALPPGAPPAEAAAPSASAPSTIARTPATEAGAAPAEGTSGNAAAAGAEEGSSGNAAEVGNPEGQTPPAEAASSNPPGEEGAAGSEEVASAPPASAAENAPAAIPAARWPEDLARELQAADSAKGGAGKLFRSGLQAMKSRDYAAAVERFGMIQKKFPHSDLTEPAAYFSASALNEMGKYDQAILQYNDLVMRYPKGKYASEALLREAQDFVQINDKVDARLTLQKLVNEHAGTPEAAAANAMMKNLESD